MRSIGCSNVIRLTPATSNTSPATRTALAPCCIALDRAGNLFFLDAAFASGNGTLLREINSAFPSLQFGDERVGGTSATQLAAVSNLGSSVVTLSGLTLSTGFLQTATGGTDCTASTVLAPGASCSLDVVFTPTAVGSVGGTITIASDTPVDVPGHNVLTLRGNGTVSTTHLRVTPNPANTGSLITFAANIPFNSGGIAPTGIITFYNGGAAIGSPVSLDANGIASFSSSTLGFSTGTHAITASYSGDANYAPSSTSNPQNLVISTAAIPPNISISVAGPETTVFHYANDACETEDYPDASAHAFRDSSGIVHMFAPHYRNYGYTGPDLLNLTHSCHLSYAAGGSSQPSDFDDEGWIESFYKTGDNNVAGLVSMDYHPYRRSTVTQCTPNAGQCWYSTITQVSSTNGGVDFSAPAPGSARFVAGAPYLYSSTHDDVVGPLVPTNIVSWNGYYYAMVSMASSYAQSYGQCVMRTTDPSVPGLWRAWDGTGYNVAFYDPYLGGTFDPAQHVCKPVSTATPLYAPVRTLLSLPGGGFALIMSNAQGVDTTGAKTATVLASTSSDLINWSKPVTSLISPYTTG